MKISIVPTIVLVASLLEAQVLAANVMSLPIRRQSNTATLEARRGVKRNTGTLVESIDNQGVIYTANVTVGTPPQPLILVLDTGSSDAYVLASNISDCEINTCSGGFYDSTASSTYKLIEKNGFDIQYVDNSESAGDVISDNFGIGGITIRGLELGLAFQTDVYFGILGIGYDTHEAIDPRYPNFIDALVSQGIINYKAYSLYLDSLEDNTGSILFGGIDTDKYSGPLNIIPILKDPIYNTYQDFLVPLNSLAMVDGTGNATELLTSTIDIILDSGTTYMLLPASTIKKIAHFLDAVSDGSGSFFVNCDNFQNSNISWTFGLGKNTTIRVPFSELVVPLDLVGISLRYPPFANTCKLGAEEASRGGPYLVGDIFLRSAYVVYDLTNNQIGIAQTSFGSNSSNIQEIDKSAKGIPALVGHGTNTLAPSTPASTSIAAAITLPPTTRAASTATSAPDAPLASSVTAASSAKPTSGATLGQAGPDIVLMLGVSALCILLLLDRSIVPWP